MNCLIPETYYAKASNVFPNNEKWLFGDRNDITRDLWDKVQDGQETSWKKCEKK